MTLAQLCDLAYIMQIEHMEKRYLAVEIANYIGRANGAEGEMVTLEEKIEEFDTWLYSELERDIDQEYSAIQRFFRSR